MIDSEGWQCPSCHVEYIGRRPADDTCPPCVVLAMTTDPCEGSARKRVEALSGRFPAEIEPRIPTDIDQWRQWLKDPVFGPERMARVRAAKHGNREASESIRDDYAVWKATQPRYPGISVELLAGDEEAEPIISDVAELLRQGGVTPAEIEAFREQCASRDSDDPLAVCMRWVEVIL